MDIPELVSTLFHDPAIAIALAPKDQSVDTLVELYRERTAVARVSWNPYLYNPLLRRRLGRIRARTLLCWGAHDRLAPLACAATWQSEIPGAELASSAALATSAPGRARGHASAILESPSDDRVLSPLAQRTLDEVLLLHLMPYPIEHDEPTSW